MKVVNATDGEETCKGIIYKVEATPVSISISAQRIIPATGKKASTSMNLDSITFLDGSVLEDIAFTSWGESNFSMDAYLSVQSLRGVDMSQIDYITIDGVDLQIYK